MDKKKKIIYSFLASIFCFGSFLFAFKNVIADNASSVVVSEIQISGESANDEFIELYNQTSKKISLEGWDIKKKTKTGTVSNIVTNISGIIPASGYFLIVPRANCGEAKNESCFKGLTSADGSYTTNNFLAKDNSLSVFDSENNLIDLVGWGEADSFEGGSFGSNPEDGQSLERKKENGSYRDSGNNKDDFVIQNDPGPQNSKIAAEEEDDENNSAEDQEHDEDKGNSQESAGSAIQEEYVPSKIMITEFLSNPEDSDRDNEFIEVYNGGDRDEDLEGWSLEDKSGKIRIFMISKKTIIKKGAYKEFYSDETGISLNNTGDGVILRNTKGIVASETPVSDAAAEDVSFSLDENNVWKWTKRPTPGRKNIIVYDEPKPKEPPKKIEVEVAKGEENKKEEEVSFSGPGDEYDFSDGLMITEIFPNPAGIDNKLGYEWIEIYNNGDADIDLKGWQIDDILKKGSKPYVIEKEMVIKRGTSLVFSNEDTKIIFNNSEDEANLLWPDGTVVDSVRYAKSKEGFSYAIAEDGSWRWTSVLTPGKKNVLESKDENIQSMAETNMAQKSIVVSEDVSENGQETEDEKMAESNEISYIETDIENAKKMSRFTNVKISGTVSTPPGVFSENSFYISGSGIQVYSYKTKFSGINIGDKIEALGTVSEVGGEKRLLVEKNTDIKILSHDNLLEPKMISTGDAGERYEGYLVVVEGKVSSINSDVFYVDDGSGEIKVYIKPQAGISMPEIKLGDPMIITGEVSRTSLGYRILPRFPGDIRTSRISSISSEEDPCREALQKDKFSSEKKSAKIPIYNYIFAMVGILILVDWGRLRIKKNK